MTIPRLVSMIKTVVLKTQETLDSKGLEITSFSVKIAITQTEKSSVGGDFKLGPIKIGGGTSIKSKNVDQIQLKFEKSDIELELQDDTIDERLIKLIVEITQQIEQSVDIMPEFEVSQCKALVHFSLDENDTINLAIFDTDIDKSASHAIELLIDSK